MSETLPSYGELLKRAYDRGREDRENEMIRDYNILKDADIERLLINERKEICEKLQRWADETRKVNPDIAIGYDHSIALICASFQADAEIGVEEWNGQEE